MNLLLGSVILINGIAFCTYGIDKKKAMNYEWRIPETTLFLLAIIGGSVGAWAAMYVFRHKTKHKSFVLGIPIILALQIFVALLIMDSMKY